MCIYVIVCKPTSNVLFHPDEVINRVFINYDDFLYSVFAHHHVLSAATDVLFRKVNISYFNFLDNYKSDNAKLITDDAGKS